MTLSEEEKGFHKKLAVSLFNETWNLMEKEELSVTEVDQMIASCHASRFHWSLVGTYIHLLRGDWQLSRMYAVCLLYTSPSPRD